MPELLGRWDPCGSCRGWLLLALNLVSCDADLSADVITQDVIRERCDHQAGALGKDLGKEM